MCWEIIKLVSGELSGSGKWICKKYIPNNTKRYYFKDDGVPLPLENLDGFNPIGKEIIIFIKNNMYRVCLQKSFIIPNLIYAYIYIVQVNESKYWNIAFKANFKILKLDSMGLRIDTK